MADEEKVTIKARIDSVVDPAMLREMESYFKTVKNQLTDIEKLQKRIGELNDKERENLRNLKQQVKESNPEYKSWLGRVASVRQAGMNAMNEMFYHGRIDDEDLTEADRLTGMGHLASGMGRLSKGATTLAQLGFGFDDEEDEGAEPGRHRRGRAPIHRTPRHYQPMNPMWYHFRRRNPMIAGILQAFGIGAHGGGAAGGGAAVPPGAAGGGGAAGAAGAGAAGGAAGGLPPLPPAGLGMSAGAIAAIGVAVTAFWRIAAFMKVSVDYWRQVEKSTLTIATNVGATTDQIESQNQRFREAGRGMGFSVMERQQFSGMMARAGFGDPAAMSAQAQQFSRALRISGEQGASFVEQMGMATGAGRGGTFDLAMAFGAIGAGNMRSAGGLSMQAQQMLTQGYSTRMGPVTAGRNQEQILRAMAGLQKTTIGRDPQMVAMVAQTMTEGMRGNETVHTIMQQRLQKEHPNWTYQDVEDQIMKGFDDPENNRVFRRALSAGTGGDKAMMESAFAQMFPSLAAPEIRREILGMRAPSRIPRGDVTGAARAVMATTAGQRAIGEEAKTDLQFAAADVTGLGRAADFASKALYQLGNGILGGLASDLPQEQ